MSNFLLLIITTLSHYIPLIKSQSCPSSPINTAYSCCTSSLSIAATVTSITSNAYRTCATISGVTVPMSVKTIGLLLLLKTTCALFYYLIIILKLLISLIKAFIFTLYNWFYQLLRYRIVYLPFQYIFLYCCFHKCAF
jgi:hypothetical protein